MSSAARRTIWIISPWWDLTYLVASPLLIVPLVLLALRQQLTPEQVSLAVISFASLGHHLPGFMRAYGDRDLFLRFRWRFLLAPPLALGLALLFTPPKFLAETLGLPWQHLHGLELILLLWGTWHGLMQTYGFMRIYDLRQGEHHRRDARLDHALCLAMFVCGVVFSDARVYGVAQAMWQSGMPIFGPPWLTAVRWVVGIASILVAVAYLVNLFGRIARGQPVNVVKLLLAAITGWFFWYTGRLSTNLLIGLAMFEIYHALQYYAIVWIYNRRLFERTKTRFGPLGFLFRDRYTMLGVYLALIAAYSSIRYFTGDGSDYIFTPGKSTDAYQWLFALFVASSLLHFYFDGFIWKVREKKTQENLVDEEDGAADASLMVSGLAHAAKWSVLLILIGLLLYSERQLLAESPTDREAQLREALGQLTPELPEVKLLRSRAALAEGNADEAVRLAQEAAALRPHAARVHAEAGAVLLSAKRYEEAGDLLQLALERGDRDWRTRVDLGLAFEGSGALNDAERWLREAIELAPTAVSPRLHLAEFLRRQNRPAEAAEVLSEVVRQDRSDGAPAVDLQVWLALGDAYRSANAEEAALETFRRAAEAYPEAAAVHYQWGLTWLMQGDPATAIDPLRRATALDDQMVEAFLQLGDAFYALRKWPPAVDAYRRAVDLSPENDDAWVNLASSQLNQGQASRAERSLREGLKHSPDSAKLLFTLGLLLEQTGRFQEAEPLLNRAAELGIGSTE